MASNETAHAGIGADVTVNGLDSLVKANEQLSKMKSFSEDLKRSMGGMQVNFKGMSDFNDVLKQLKLLKDSVNAKVNIEVSGDAQLTGLLLKVKGLVNEIKLGMGSISRQATEMTRSVADVGKAFSGASVSTKDFQDEMKYNTQAVQHFEETFKSMMHKTSEDAKQPLTALEKLRELMHGIKGAIAGSAIGVGVANMAANAASGAKNFVQEGVQLNQGGIATTNMWKNSGLDQKDIDAMSKEVANIRGAADMAGGSIINMQKAFRTLTGSAPQARELTNTVAAFGKQSGQSSDQIAQSAQKMIRVLNANGKSGINKSMFDRLFSGNQALGREIQKVSGMSTDAFNKMLASGKLTGNQLKQYMLESSKDSGKAWQDYGKTFNGMMDGIKGTWTNMKAVFAKPFVNAISQSLGSMNKNGKGVETLQKDALALTKTLGAKVGNFVGNAIKFLTDNAKPLGNIVKSLGQIVSAIGKGVWSVFAGTLSAIGGHSKQASGGIQGVSNGLGALAKHQTSLKLLGSTLVGIFAISKIVKFIMFIKSAKDALMTMRSAVAASKTAQLLLGSSFDKTTGSVKLFSKEGLIAKGAMAAWTGVTKAAAVAQKIFNVAFKSSPWGWVALAIAAVITVVVELYKHFKPFRDLCNNVGKWFIDMFKGVIKWAGGLLKSVGKMASGIGHFFGGIWKAGKEKFSALKSTVSKSFSDLSKNIKKTQSDTNKSQKAQLKVFGDIFTGKFKNLKKDVPAMFKSMFTVMKDIGKTYYNFLNDLTGGKLGKMLKIFKEIGTSISNVWKDLWNGVGHFFEGIWKWIGNTAASGINKVIGVINGGIGAIDGVIHTFGGSSTAIGKVSNVHFATGTGMFSSKRRPITKPTFATLNDGNDSPATGNKEMIIHPNGMPELVQGRNTKRLLAPNTEVLTASETAMLLNAQTGQFAKGTGFLGSIESSVSGAWDGLKNFAGSIAQKVKMMGKIMAHPIKYLESMFSNFTTKGDLMQELGSGLVGKGKDAASSWWQTLISMAHKAADDGGGSSDLLKAVEKYGRGKFYVWGATGPNSFDCSGLVQYALKQMGINYPRTSGAQIDYAQHVPEGQQQPGDLIGNAGHIGVYAGHGQYWAAASPSSHPNIGMWPVSYFPDGPHKWGRVKGIKATSGKSKKDTGSSSIEKMIKAQTGGFLKWIAKHMGSSVDGGAGNPVGDGVQKWIPLVKKAAKAMGVSLGDGGLNVVLKRIQQESNGNPTVTNNWDSNAKAGNASVGLVQYTPTTMASWAVKGHNNIRNGYDQLLALFNDSNWYADINHSGGWGPTGHKRRAKGGTVLKGEPYLVGEEGPEIFQPAEQGKIITHNQSKRMMKNMNSKSSIKYQPIINIKGNADETSISKLSKALERHGDSLMDMLEDKMGFNDEGGMTI